LFDETGERIRAVGREFGATTGRPRRCGWLDLPALKYSVMINGVTGLIMTKADVLSGFGDIQVCTAYRVNGVETEALPYNTEANYIEPVYTSMPGWSEDLTGVRSYDQIPENLKRYISFLEKALGVPVKILSVGPDREQTIEISR